MGRNDETETKLLLSVPDVPEFNPKSLCSALVLKACVVLVAICLMDGNVKPGGTLDDF